MGHGVTLSSRDRRGRRPTARLHLQLQVAARLRSASATKHELALLYVGCMEYGVRRPRLCPYLHDRMDAVLLQVIVGPPAGVVGGHAGGFALESIEYAPTAERHR